MATLNKIRVSIVEDDPSIRESLASLVIHGTGMELYTIHPNAEDALMQLQGPGPDLVIMDINLPGRSGIECVKGLKETCPATQFLMYTVQDDDQQVFEALKAGANGYILKESTPDQILEAVRELMDGGAPMSAPVARRVVTHMRRAGATPSDGTTPEGLTTREGTVLELLAQGLLYKEIAARTGTTTGTVKQHIHRIYAKLHVQNRTEAVNRFYGR
ncbi:MAG: response regulator transcription factor [Flavobacteriales bacterium]